MNKITFSHIYPKLWGQKTAKLLAVELLSAKEVQENKDLLEYDTRYSTEKSIAMQDKEFDDYYPLPKSDNLIQLVFLGDKGIPFCTIRSAYMKIGYKLGNKLDYYKGLIGEEFEIDIVIKAGD